MSEPTTGYTVTLRDTTTGETRERHMPYEWSAFWWTDGNFGCDCNRGDVFHDDSPDVRPCGDTRYELVRVVLDDGRDVTAETK